MRVAILFSGRGSNLKSIIDMARKEYNNISIPCTVTDNPEALGIEHSLVQGIEVCIIDHLTRYNDNILTKILSRRNIDLVVLAGFMRILNKEFCEYWEGRCINIHPSILPNYPGLNTHKRVLQSGDKVHGCTIHYVSPEVDCGPIIAQQIVEVVNDDTEESLSKKVLAYENQLYPLVVKEICKNKISLINGEVYHNEKKLTIPLSIGDLS